MGLPYNENFIILTSTVLTDPSVWQMDGRTCICCLAATRKPS